MTLGKVLDKKAEQMENKNSIQRKKQKAMNLKSAQWLVPTLDTGKHIL